MACEAAEYALRAAAADRVPALLTVARRHRVEPRPSQFADAADRFARWWVRQTDDELAPRRWDAPDHALDWVRDVLRMDLAGPGSDVAVQAVQAVQAVRDRWWDPLVDAASTRPTRWTAASGPRHTST